MVTYHFQNLDNLYSLDSYNLATWLVFGVVMGVIFLAAIKGFYLSKSYFKDNKFVKVLCVVVAVVASAGFVVGDYNYSRNFGKAPNYYKNESIVNKTISAQIQKSYPDFKYDGNWDEDFNGSLDGTADVRIYDNTQQKDLRCRFKFADTKMTFKTVLFTNSANLPRKVNQDVKAELTCQDSGFLVVKTVNQ